MNASEAAKTLVAALELRDSVRANEKLAELRSELQHATSLAWRAFKRSPTPETREAARKCILAEAMLCDLVGNNLGYQHMRFVKMREVDDR